MPEPAETTGPRGEVVERFLRLPRSDQLRVYRQLGRYLTTPPDAGSGDARSIEQQGRVVEALQLAIRHLRDSGKLGSDQRPTAKAFDRTSRQLGLDITSSAAVRAFGLWREAVAAATDEAVREGPGRRRARQAAATRRRHRIDFLESIRQWLASEPADESRGDYAIFVERENSRRRDRSQWFPSLQTIVSRASLPWTEMVRVAKGEVTVEQARADYLQQQLGSLDQDALIGGRLLAVMLAVNARQKEHVVKRPGFPARAAVLADKVELWRLGDVRNYIAGKKFAERKPDWLQSQIVASDELAGSLSISANSLREHVRRQHWQQVPKPRGRTGWAHYWMRDDIERWGRARSQSVRPERT